MAHLVRMLLVCAPSLAYYSGGYQLAESRVHLNWQCAAVSVVPKVGHYFGALYPHRIQCRGEVAPSPSVAVVPLAGWHCCLVLVYCSAIHLWRIILFTSK